MKPPRFAYAAPETVEETLALLAERGDGAAILAGGQSLLPVLNFRFGAPSLLVDVNRIGGLGDVTVAGDILELGALVRHAELMRSPLVRERCPLLAEAARHVGHAAIRNRGTLGGSLAHADPAAELPAVVAALGGTIELASRNGSRTVSHADFALGPLMTTKGPDELVVSVRVPAHDGWRWGFHEVARRSGDFALAGAVVAIETDGSAVRRAHVAVFGVAPVATRLPLVEDALRACDLDAAPDAATRALAEEELEVLDDGRLPTAYRRHLASVSLANAVRSAVERPTGGSA